MKKPAFKLLTFVCLLIVLSPEVLSAVLKQEVNKTHLRWNIFTDKSNLVVEKRGNKVALKTLNNDLYSTLKEDLKKVKKNNRYLKSVRFDDNANGNNAFAVEIELANADVEVFNFFREREKRHVLDFWSEAADKETLKPVKKRVAKTKLPKKKAAKAKPIIKPVLKAKPVKKVAKKKIRKVKDDGYRDFRYGASFIWDYDSLSPEYKPLIDIKRKTPEYFYPIKDVNYKESEKLSHLQLAINYYRKKKYGLMYKALKLFKSKYGDDENDDLIEYLKVNAILRENMNGSGQKTKKMAISILDTLGNGTSNYDLKKAIYKYLLSYSYSSGEYVRGLNTAKKYYIATKDNFDYEESQDAVESILYNLAKLNQVDRLQELVKDKTIVKIMPKQKLLAYELYIKHKLGNIDDVLEIYTREKRHLTRPYLVSIQFNVAESLFRVARYDEAISMFDEFVTHYSFHTRASDARLRIALMYDITDKDIDKVALLYKNAINRSQSFDISYEARIRYVGLETIRKKKLGPQDLEKRVFLDLPEEQKINRNLKKLLWQTRLRTYIADRDYRRSLVYLSVIPVTSLTPVERRVFEADAAEVVYGIIFKHYQESDYSAVVKTWNQYKKRYVKKVARDPYINFIVGRSYLKIGLYKGFNELVTHFSKLTNNPSHTFPHWIDRPELANKSLIKELRIIKNIKLKNYALAMRQVNEIKSEQPNLHQLNYYSGLIHFEKGDYKEASKSFEKFFTAQDRAKVFDPVDLAEMITMYAESLYNLNKLDKFQKVAAAILSDTKKFMSTNKFMQSARERLMYLDIEIDAGKKKTLSTLETKLAQFKKLYPESNYKGRIDYLLARSMVENNKKEEARKLFQELLDNENVVGSIKELARSELSLMTIKEQTL